MYPMCHPWGCCNFFFAVFADWLFTPSLKKLIVMTTHFVSPCFPSAIVTLPRPFHFCGTFQAPKNCLQLNHLPSHHISTLTSTPACHFPSISHRVLTPAPASSFKPQLPGPGSEAVSLANCTCLYPVQPSVFEMFFSLVLANIKFVIFLPLLPHPSIGLLGPNKLHASS